MAFTVVQTILSLLLIGAILIQHKGSGIGSAFGSSSAIYYTRRGLERSLHIATIILAALFLSASLIRFII